MLFLKNSIKPLLSILITILFLTLILTFFSYINWLGPKTVAVLKIIIPILAFIIGGFMIGKRSVAKGWMAGLKIGLIFLVILILFNFLGLNHKFKIFDLIYYLILLTSSMFGSIIGINKKSDDNNV
ncbi:MAG: TIGR04086 family membrane protein [Mollicutes bacterium]|nr:TIGR04086 family membrane protein [Mollicutes bacterium]